MATKKKAVEAVATTQDDYSDTISYSLKVLKYDEKSSKYVTTLAALEIPRHFKLTFGPGIVKAPTGTNMFGDPAATTRGCMLRIYDGKMQRGVIPGVLSFMATDNITYVETFDVNE